MGFDFCLISFIYICSSIFGLTNAGESELPLPTGMKGYHFSIADHSMLSMGVCTIEKIHHHTNVQRLRTLFRTNIENYWVRARKKSLKIPAGLSESVNRRTDNIMAKTKGQEGQTTIYKTLHRKPKTKSCLPPLILL